jgi:hypothetical protein
MILLPSFTTEADLSTFRNGQYLVDYKSDQIPDFLMDINKNKYIKYQQNTKVEEKIIKVHSDLYIFRDKYLSSKVDTSRLSKIINKSFGEQCIEIRRTSGSKIYFRTTYVANLHLTINEGVIINKK